MHPRGGDLRGKWGRRQLTRALRGHLQLGGVLLHHGVVMVVDVLVPTLLLARRHPLSVQGIVLYNCPVHQLAQVVVAPILWEAVAVDGGPSVAVCARVGGLVIEETLRAHWGLRASGAVPLWTAWPRAGGAGVAHGELGQGTQGAGLFFFHRLLVGRWKSATQQNWERAVFAANAALLGFQLPVHEHGVSDHIAIVLATSDDGRAAMPVGSCVRGLVIEKSLGTSGAVGVGHRHAVAGLHGGHVLHVHGGGYGDQVDHLFLVHAFLLGNLCEAADELAEVDLASALCLIAHEDEVCI
mmetsp:Transcript_26186/g.56801  ORF Transcript_26186/g.56801 Transcript_26186/m.56801 type:complete len:297 (+) Transcript_26186:760-1650(+)